MTQKTKLQIIEETVAYYSEDVSRRSVIRGQEGFVNGEFCLYNGPEGQKCAFSRCTHPIPKEYDNPDDPFSAVEILREKGQEILLEEYRGHDAQFWADLQSFHDRTTHWDDKGLTELGKYHVEHLKEVYS